TSAERRRGARSGATAPAGRGAARRAGVARRDGAPHGAAEPRPPAARGAGRRPAGAQGPAAQVASRATMPGG
ncbi:MAG: hypothetical protein ACK56F_01080, partial [bacterium]